MTEKLIQIKSSVFFNIVLNRSILLLEVFFILSIFYSQSQIVSLFFAILSVLNGSFYIYVYRNSNNLKFLELTERDFTFHFFTFGIQTLRWSDIYRIKVNRIIYPFAISLKLRDINILFQEKSTFHILIMKFILILTHGNLRINLNFLDMRNEEISEKIIQYFRPYDFVR